MSMSFLLFAFVHVYAQETGTVVKCRETNNENISWLVTNPDCPEHGTQCQEYIDDPAGTIGGGPYIDYCCSICLYPMVQPDSTEE